MPKVYIGIGTNMGDREANLEESVELLSRNEFIKVLQQSSIYETAPVGYLDQDAFLNIALLIETSLEPLALLDVTSGIENEMGRKRLIHWGPRIIDLDLLYYEGVHMNTEKLILPHPRILERAFVLQPLMELGANFPDFGELSEALEGLKDQEIRIYRKK